MAHLLLSIQMVIRIVVSALLGAALYAPVTAADEIRVAVASNFTAAAKALIGRFHQQSDHTIPLITGSTGKLYAQIVHGAPYHLYFAADQHRPTRLEEEGQAITGSRFTYAVGELVLWSPDQSKIDSTATVLRQQSFSHLAIANPKLAPYGRAAKEFLQAQGLWEKLQPHLVRGENIAQTLQYIDSGNAELGLVSTAQLLNIKTKGSRWQVPQKYYTPIEQQVVLLKEQPAARNFLDFVKSREAAKIIQQFGYSLAHDQ